MNWFTGFEPVMDAQIENIALIWIVIGLISFPFILKTKAPYGRHNRKGWGAQISNKLGWIIMESVSFLVMAGFYFWTRLNCSDYVFFLMILWLGHYFYRSFIYPLLTRTSDKKIPLFIVSSAILFNIINSGLNGYFLTIVDPYIHYWNTPEFYIGGLLFGLGFLLHLRSDRKLIGLRSSKESGYSIPFGGAFKYISCPNHFGEIIQWFGFAIMAWNIAALSFALWTVFNLVPRAIHHHKWYQSNFDNYPKERKAIIPFIV
jgi:hypothetical protein